MDSIDFSLNVDSIVYVAIRDGTNYLNDDWIVNFLILGY